MDTFTVKVVTPEGVFLEREATLVELPTEDGEIGIFAGHVPLLATIGVGEMRLYHNDATEYVALAGGFVQVHADAVRLLTAFAATEAGGETEEAMERARRALEEMHSLPQDVAQAEMAMLKSQLVKFSELRKSRRTRV